MKNLEQTKKEIKKILTNAKIRRYTDKRKDHYRIKLTRKLTADEITRIIAINPGRITIKIWKWDELYGYVEMVHVIKIYKSINK